MGIFESLSSMQERITGGWPGGQSQAGAATQARAAAQAGMSAASQAGGGGETRQLASIVSEVVASMRQMVEAQRAFSSSLKTATEGLRGLGGAAGGGGAAGNPMAGAGGWGGAARAGIAGAVASVGFEAIGSFAGAQVGPMGNISDSSRFLANGNRFGAGILEGLNAIPGVSKISGAMASGLGGSDYATFQARGAIAGYQGQTAGLFAQASGDPLRMIAASRRQQIEAANLEAEKLPEREAESFRRLRLSAIDASSQRQRELVQVQEFSSFASASNRASTMRASATGSSTERILAQSRFDIAEVNNQLAVKMKENENRPDEQMKAIKLAQSQRTAIQEQSQFQLNQARMERVHQSESYTMQTASMRAQAGGMSQEIIAQRAKMQIQDTQQTLESRQVSAGKDTQLAKFYESQANERISAINEMAKRESTVEESSFRSNIGLRNTASQASRLSLTRDRNQQIRSQFGAEMSRIGINERNELIERGGMSVGANGELTGGDSERVKAIRGAYGEERRTAIASRDFQSSEYKRELSQSITSSMENSQTRIRLGLAQFEFERAEVVAGSKRRQLGLEFANLPDNEKKDRSKQYATELRAIEFERMAALRASGVGLGVSTSGEVATRDAMDPAKIEAGLDRIADNTKPLEGFVPALNRLAEVMQQKQAAVFVQ